MGLPSKRRTKSSKLRRASHFALQNPNITTCSNCGKLARMHHVCLHCGMYQGTKVLHKASKAEKQLRKRQKQEKTQEQKA